MMPQAFGILYFSGTGNTKLLAERLGGLLGAPVHSIEENFDRQGFFDGCQRIILMYPVHYSVPPMIMRDFFVAQGLLFEHKEIISIVTQMIVSGDGARAAEDFLPATAEIIDTHHIKMPNNIVNIPFVPVSSARGNYRKVRRALRKLERIAAKINQGKFKRRHCSFLARKIGDSQRIGGLKSEKGKKDKVWVSGSCLQCGLCAKICPAGNFLMDAAEGKAVPQGRCTLCMRCENRCPAKAIRVLLDRPVNKQYPGPLTRKASGKNQG